VNHLKAAGSCHIATAICYVKVRDRFRDTVRVRDRVRVTVRWAEGSDVVFTVTRQSVAVAMLA